MLMKTIKWEIKKEQSILMLIAALVAVSWVVLCIMPMPNPEAEQLIDNIIRMILNFIIIIPLFAAFLFIYIYPILLHVYAFLKTSYLERLIAIPHRYLLGVRVGRGAVYYLLGVFILWHTRLLSERFVCDNYFQWILNLESISISGLLFDLPSYAIGAPLMLLLLFKVLSATVKNKTKTYNVLITALIIVLPQLIRQFTWLSMTIQMIILWMVSVPLIIYSVYWIAKYIDEHTEDIAPC